MKKEIKRTEVLTDVPADQVDRIIKDYKDIDGITDVTKEEQANGMFKITAVFPVKVEET